MTVSSLLATALALVSLVHAPRAQATQGEIDAAIAKGVEHLSRTLDIGLEVGAGSLASLPLPARVLSVRPGLRALALYTLLKCGVERDDPRCLCLLRSFGFGKQQSTYDAACLLLALVEHDAFGNHDWILELSDQLKGWQANGAWGYPAGRDLSNTQFGALGLWAASRAGVKVDASVWEDLALAVLEHEGRKGGFSYGYEAPTPTASMTAAGLGTLALCEFQLTLLGELDDGLAAELRLSRERGVEWLVRNDLFESNRTSGPWPFYQLYGIERVGGFAGMEYIGAHNWYEKGSTYLVEAQSGTGAWGSTASTCFALLFLGRATSGPRPAITGGGKRSDDPWRPRNDPEIAVNIAAEDEGDGRVALWIAGFGRDAAAPFERTEERGLGPRVERVVYLANEEPIAVALGDPSAPPLGARYRVLHHFMTSGKKRIVARVYVRTASDRRRGRERIEVIESPTILLDIDSAAPRWLPAELARDRGTVSSDLLDKRSRLASSSVIKDTTGLPASDYGAGMAFDGCTRTPWLADPSDPSPELSLTLSRPRKAHRVVIHAAYLAGGEPDALGRSMEFELRLNGGDPLRARAGYDPRRPVLIELDRAVVVKRIQVRLLGRAPGRIIRSPGIGEILLEHD